MRNIWHRLRLAATFLAVAALVAACGQRPLLPRTEVVEILIDAVEVQVVGSDPVRVQVHVKGVVGDSCNTLDKVTQAREGNQVEVTITALRKTDGPCLEYAQLYDQVLELEGTFPPGEYEVAVNGVVRTFMVP